MRSLSVLGWIEFWGGIEGSVVGWYKVMALWFAVASPLAPM